MLNVKQRYRFKKLFKAIATGRKTQDDYAWEYYSELYEDGLEDVARKHTLALRPGDYSFRKGCLVPEGGILPLHQNYQIIYETILQLNPDSVLEVGCGCGDHLHNLQILAPHIRLAGCDISQGQIDFLQRKHPDLIARTAVHDIRVSPPPLGIDSVHVIFTQAVIMHIRKHQGRALANLFRMATRQVILMENWLRHDFLGEIRTLSRAGEIPWEKIFFYYREAGIPPKPHLMIVSATELAYPELSDYRTLADTVAGI